MEDEQDGRADSVKLAGESITIDTLLERCHSLLGEIQQFQENLVQHRKYKEVDVRHFQNAIVSEQKSLDKFVASNPNNERTIHTLRSSNLRFYSAVWDAAKQTTGLVTFNKRFYWGNSTSRDLKRQGKPKKRGALVDIVAQDGEQWIKVSTVTEKRLLFELAKQGWEFSGSSDDEDEGSTTPTSNGHLASAPPTSNGISNQNSDDEDDKLELIRLAQDLQKASQATRVRYKHPHVHFVLPNIFPGHVPEIDHILSTIHSTGATTSCAPDLQPHETPLHTIFAQMLPFSTRQLSQTLNIDCTILLALVSDLSHYTSSSIPLEAASGAKDGTPHPASVRQLKLESEEQLLPNILYPLLQSRTLVCTASAARRMREIVHVIGTEGEKARTDFFLSSSPSTPNPKEEIEKDSLLSHLRPLTHYPLPPTLHLPIHIIPDAHLLTTPPTIDSPRLPPIAAKIARQLSDINRSVFLYGWLEGYTTVSSNRAVARAIEAAFEEEGSEELGPDVWLVGTARSLVGKERGRG